MKTPLKTLSNLLSNLPPAALVVLLILVAFVTLVAALPPTTAIAGDSGECRELVPLTKETVELTPTARKINSMFFAFNDDAQLVAHLTVTRMSRNRQTVTNITLPMKKDLVIREGNNLVLNAPGRPVIAKRVWWAHPKWVLEKGVSLVEDVDVKQGASPSVHVKSISLCLR